MTADSIRTQDSCVQSTAAPDRMWNAKKVHPSSVTTTFRYHQHGRTRKVL